jgi:hypothetical protein
VVDRITINKDQHHLYRRTGDPSILRWPDNGQFSINLHTLSTDIPVISLDLKVSITHLIDRIILTDLQ